MEIITSRQNPNYKEIRKLLEDKKNRERRGNFFVDGVNFVFQAVENDWEIEQLVYVPEMIETDFMRKVVSGVAADKHFPVNRALYEPLSVKKNIQGVGAVVRQKVALNTLFPGAGIVLENIANPGNLGSIARLGAGFGIENLYTISPAVDFFHPETVRASMGAIFHLRLVGFDSIKTMRELVLEKSYRCIGTSLDEEAVDLSEHKGGLLSGDDTLIWFGSEQRGLTSESKNLCQTLLRIPISSAVDSLNIAESAAIVIYELFGKK